MYRQLFKLIIAASLASPMGCEEPAQLEIGSDNQQLVVVSNFTNDKAVQVVVSKSQSILEETEIEYVLDADVEIFQERQLLESLKLYHPQDSLDIPYYFTTYTRPKAGITYTIHVDAPGCEPVTATSRIPASIGLLSINISEFQLEDEEANNSWLASYNINLSFEDPQQEKNFYHISLFQQIQNFILAEGDTLVTDTYLQPVFFDPEDNSNYRVAHVGGGLLLSDELFDGEIIDYGLPMSIQLNREGELLGKIFVELRSVSEEYFRYFAALSRQRLAPNSPFAEPVILFDNIDGGKGIFAGYNASIDSLSVQK